MTLIVSEPEAKISANLTEYPPDFLPVRDGGFPACAADVPSIPQWCAIAGHGTVITGRAFMTSRADEDVFAFDGLESDHIIRTLTASMATEFFVHTLFAAKHFFHESKDLSFTFSAAICAVGACGKITISGTIGIFICADIIAPDPFMAYGAIKCGEGERHKQKQ